MSLRCVGCQDSKPSGQGSCARCGGISFYCSVCRSVVVSPDSEDCLHCASRAVVMALPVLPSLPAVSPRATAMQPVREVYEGGRLGVTATVTMPPGDVEILNGLMRLAELLYAMATKAGSGFLGYTDHTRAMISDMRKLAGSIQDEIDQRRGPAG